MYEYRLNKINNELCNILKILGIDLIEEDIYSKTEYIFYSENKLDSILTSLSLEYSLKEVDSLGWEDKWKEYLRPGQLTENVDYIFDTKDKKEFRKSILINPALAFGTGNHPTTKIAARLLEKVSAGNTVLDVGCGSAILSILASITGAKKVYGFDIDKIAMVNAKENILLNNCKNICLWAGTTESIRQNIQFDVVCANIISSVLIDIGKNLFKHTGKYLVVSGILKSEMEEFLNKFKNSQFSVVETLSIENWFGAIYKRL